MVVEQMNPNLLKLMLNIYPPYWGTGIVITSIAPDYRQIIVQMKLHWYNRNYVRTHFGGSLYAMTDPFFMLMLIRILGPSYTVWDKAAYIDFMRPGRGVVSAKFTISEEQVREIMEHTTDGQKYFPKFTVDIHDEQGQTVARVTKTLYVRKKDG